MASKRGEPTEDSSRLDLATHECKNEKSDDDMDESLDESDDGGLMIADMQDTKETDDTENDAEDDDQPKLIFNGQMTRRQSKQFKDASDSFAVYSVRNGTNKASKNRTCEYCHVVKATPAALVRHLRKHTGERPFVCHIEQCGKSYKAKRSLNLHQTTHHPESGKMSGPMPPSLLSAQIPLTTSPLTQVSPTPAISESTKSLLRETLESSRKARDGSTGPEAHILALSGLSRLQDRLSTPNLVNLLTTDLSKGQLSADAVTNYLLSSVKRERTEEDEMDRKSLVMAEEQAEDLSMSASRRSAKSSAASTSLLERNFKCDFCNKTFRHEISCINHTRTAHGIVLNPQHLPAVETKPSVIQLLSHAKQESTSVHKSEPSIDLSYPTLGRPAHTSATASLGSALKVDLPSAGGEGDILEESNTLPYHITSHMAQDFNTDLRLKDSEKSVLAEDGGNRRMRVTVEKETVIATRIDGVNNISGRRATVFKCHMCSRIFSSLLRFNHHLPSHCDSEVQTYDCRYCEASFRSHIQIVKHLQCHREKFTGLNPSGTALNSSALLLEEFNKKHKEPHSNNVSINNNGTFNHSESSVSIPEPGERANGGYSCVKCQKRFSREYLLQRHMRIHQTANIFFCHACHYSFTSELDLMEHQRASHGFMQYTNLLKSLNASIDSKLLQNLQHSDNNNNHNIRSQAYPLVDMKAFDLRRGEQVEVRMTSEATERAEIPVLDSFDQSKALLMMMSPGQDKKFNPQVLQAFFQDNEPIRQSLTTVEDYRKLVKLEEEMKQNEKRKHELEERHRIDRERRRLNEQEKLKQKLAQEGMGDVIVVLPDAPPMDEAAAREQDMNSGSDRPTDLSMKSQIGVGFMARKSENQSTPSGSTSATETKLLPTTEEMAIGVKRLLSAGVDQTLTPPAKNRRKALKPQRIQCQNGQNQTAREVTQPNKGDNNNNNTDLYKINSTSNYGDSLPRESSAFSQVSVFKAFVPEQSSKQVSPLTIASTSSLKTVSTSYIQQTPGLEACVDPSSGAIDLSADNKTFKSIATIQSPSVGSRALSSPAASSLDPSALKKSSNHQLPLKRSTSLDPAVSDSENSLSHELTSAADLSKNSKELSLLILPTGSSAPLASSLPASVSPLDHDNLIGFPRVLWKSSQSDSPDNLSGRTQWNGKETKPNLSSSKSQASSPSPAPSPTNSDSAALEGGRRATTTSLSRTHSSARATSLSRTHSRLSVVNEPLDRNSLCKPKLLEDGRSVYSCVICHKNFLSLSDINRHMDFHEDIRPYKCKYCDYYARTNSQLKVHKLRHEGVREFCCRVCNYKGVTQSDLNRHMKSQVHLLRSNHVCSQCGEGFVTPKTLRDHSLCCTGSADKSMDCGVSANDEDMVDEDYEDEDLEESSQGSNCGLVEVKVAAM
uniref:C2H2-type domain-containing protein n=1 Tax=Biomphalaria glabrata TaxID=6526 RepID=A0A2C9LZS3_BIOGL